MTAHRTTPPDDHLPPAAGDLRPGRGQPCCGTTPGRQYLDFLSGLAVTSLGHAHPAVADAVCAQARTLLHVSNLFGTEPQREVAATLDRLIDAGPGRVFFCNSGAEANECAIKLARRWGGRGRYVRRQRLRLVPRPHPGHPARHRPAGQARAVPAAARGLPARGLARPRRPGRGHRPVGRRRAARAGAGRGGRQPGRRATTSRRSAGSATSGVCC